MNASAEHIRRSLEAVASIRELRSSDASLAAANAAVKRFQALRFQASYADLLRSPRYQTAARFFLTELYSDKDYAERDQQFARIANTIAKMFPQPVVNTAAALAEVHALTERLDDAMARTFLALPRTNESSMDACDYILSWRTVGESAARQLQLQQVLALGRSLDNLTRKPGLRTLIKLMRGPAAAAGLGSLQKFLEAGFDAFQSMRGADEFLNLIAQREEDWIRRLFDQDAATCEAQLDGLVGGLQALAK